MKFKTSFFITFFVIGMCTIMQATHNRAGEITYEQISDLTIRATITTYTRTSSFAADRDSLELFWGDGTSTTIPRTNGDGTELPNDIKLNYYIAEHTYPTRGTYKLSMEDPNRIAGILNVDFPNSVNIPFYIETTLTLLDTRFQGANSSAVLLQPPIDYACINEIFTHNPNAYDPDGDSLSYELVTPFQSEGDEVPNYLLPDQVRPGEDNSIFLDPVTGDFRWDSPKISGEFNITIKIKEYREGRLINNIIRDMQILVRTCPEINDPPSIQSPDEICVVAGETIEFEVLATDSDSGQLLTTTALGGPFEVDTKPAQFITPQNPGPSGVPSRFIWQTDCSHISKEFYQVVFKSVDDFFSTEQSGLATLKSVRIKVVGPSPEEVVAERTPSAVKISWNAPYLCEDDGLFQGFSVWRRNGSSDIPRDTCRTGLEGLGFEQIIFLTKDREGDRYVAFDADVGEGNIYCYRVLGEYAQLTALNNPFNKVESLPSEESCTRFDERDPLIIKVSVMSTDPSSGNIDVRWTLPNPDDFDTLINPGPYTITLSRATGFSGTNFVPIPGATFVESYFHHLSDTIFVDNGLNTMSQVYRYQVSIESSNGINSRAVSMPATNVFLSATGRDESISLTWDFNVPWNNSSYTVFQETSSGSHDTLGVTSGRDFLVEGLLNGVEYCFLVSSEGSYGLRNIRSPLVNESQRACTVPVDTIAPCAPALNVETICAKPILFAEQILVNTLSWSYSAPACSQATDLAAFNIYYTPIEGESYEVIASLPYTTRVFEHQLDDVIAGCYVITAIDSSGNESNISRSFCVENCPSYELGNTFTPNSDTHNDLFVPRVNLFIESIEMEIYNRWGQLVYKTTDPEINWDGKNLNGDKLSDGTYFYTCKVFEKRISGEIAQTDVLSGYIQLLRGE